MAAALQENRPGARGSGLNHPYTVFDAVGNGDLEGIVKEYVKNARNTMYSYLSMRRWSSLQELKEDEKLDEYLQSVADEARWWPSSPSSSLQSMAEVSFSALKQTTDLLLEMEGKTTKDAPWNQGQQGVSKEVDRVVLQSANILSNSRPPSSFVVQTRGKMGPNEGSPLFDGSVANATPPPLGPPGFRPSGGSGTILHLACAVDSPFALAVALAMGADARSPHTAFRRLMIHEASCSGSIGCLQLLLELGRDYALEIFDESQLKQPMDEDMDSIPFMPDSFEGLETSRPLPFSRQGMAKKSVKTERKDWIGLFRSFFELARKVMLGQMTELEAAREVLSYDTLMGATKIIVAQSCSFIVKESTVVGNPFSSPWYADGHGNTPLHWAAFKNEVDCVALLLEYHADPNARAHPSGWTPLHDAAYSNSSEAVELLLEAGAEVDIRANSGATPLCFAAQEDADGAAGVLLSKGADLGARCAGGPPRVAVQNMLPQPNGRFSGYTPLHYCAHYNAFKAARVLLVSDNANYAMEIPDLSGRLPIHVAVARGSSDVLRELLHAGARVELPNRSPSPRRSRYLRSLPRSMSPTLLLEARAMQNDEPSTPRTDTDEDDGGSATPVSSPVLRSMIPARPVTSSKPWNCLTQRSIDECRELISLAEQNWTPDRHSLFTPADRRAVVELLRVGKRLEQMGTGIFIDLWPLVLSFCGRGWFEVEMDNSPRLLPETMPSD